MTDGIDFERSVARFSGKNAAYIVDLLRTTYKVMDLCDDQSLPAGMDSEGKLLLGDFIEALEDCDSIEIVDDEEYLVDAD